jgi:hypothetical protein
MCLRGSCVVVAFITRASNVSTRQTALVVTSGPDAERAERSFEKLRPNNNGKTSVTMTATWTVGLIAESRVEVIEYQTPCLIYVFSSEQSRFKRA